MWKINKKKINFVGWKILFYWNIFYITFQTFYLIFKIWLILYFISIGSVSYLNFVNINKKWIFDLTYVFFGRSIPLMFLILNMVLKHHS